MSSKPNPASQGGGWYPGKYAMMAANATKQTFSELLQSARERSPSIDPSPLKEGPSSSASEASPSYQSPSYASSGVDLEGAADGAAEAGSVDDADGAPGQDTRKKRHRHKKKVHAGPDEGDEGDDGASLGSMKSVATAFFRHGLRGDADEEQ